MRAYECELVYIRTQKMTVLVQNTETFLPHSSNLQAQNKKKWPHDPFDR